MTFKSFIKKIVRFFNYPLSRKVVVLKKRFYIFYRYNILSLFFYFSGGVLAGKKLVVSYTPDSIACEGRYPEIFKMFKYFKFRNRGNNGGDFHRLVSIVVNLDRILRERRVEGEIAELGVWKGNTASVLAYFAEIYNREIHLFDTFEGFSERDICGVDGSATRTLFEDTSIELVRSLIANVASVEPQFHSGYFPESVPENLSEKRFCFVSLDADLYLPIKAGLEWFYPRLSGGGMIFIHDYSSGHWQGCKMAVDEFCTKHSLSVILLPDKSGTAVLI